MIIITRICVDIWLMCAERGGDRVEAVEARLYCLCACEVVLDACEFTNDELAALKKTSVLEFFNYWCKKLAVRLSLCRKDDEQHVS